MPMTCCVEKCSSRGNRKAESVVSDKQQLLSKNIDTKIILWVQNTLALSSTLFPESIDCWYVTDIHARPHKIKLINLIAHTYLNIRLHSYSKILTSSIMKVASKRQKLHKTILFYNM